MENMMRERNIFVVMAVNPNPVEKASMLTPSENKNIPMIFKLIVSSSLKKISYNISPAMNNKIIPNNKLLLIRKKFTKLLPIMTPIIGIKKCIVPTIKDNMIHFFLDKFMVPSPRESENVSILRATAIVKMLNISNMKKAS